MATKAQSSPHRATGKQGTHSRQPMSEEALTRLLRTNYGDSELQRATEDLLRWARGHLYVSYGVDVWEAVSAWRALLNGGPELKRDHRDVMWPLGLGWEPTAKTPRVKARCKALLKFSKKAKAFTDDLEQATPAIANPARLENLTTEQIVFDGFWVPQETVEAARSALGRLQGDIDATLARLEPPPGSPRCRRGTLIRELRSRQEDTPRWWPRDPSPKDVAAVSILSRVALADISDDFANREALAKSAGGSRGQSVGHLYGFLHHEQKRCGGLMKRAAK